MASYRQNIELTALPGAVVRSGIDTTNENTRKRNYVCIAVDMTEARYWQDKEGKPHFSVSLNQWPVDEQQTARLNEWRQKNGMQLLDPEKQPTHELRMAYSDDFLMKIIKSAIGEKMTEQIIANYKDKYPELSTDDKTNSESRLYKFLRNRINKQVGRSWQNRPKQPVAAVADVAQGVSGYSSAVEADPFGYAPVDDADLPF